MIGEKLSALLDAKKMKPGTLATRTGIAKSTIYSIIKRNNKSLDFSVMERICDELDVPIEYFYDKEKETPENEKKATPETGSGQITAVELEAADIIRRLPAEKQEEALKYLRYLESREDN